MNCLRQAAIWCAFLLALIALPEGRAQACMGISRATHVPPAPASEQVLIAYDQQKQREHFVRKIKFRKAEASFGFIVPVPSKPEVESEDEAVIDRLATRCSPRFSPLTFGGGGLGSGFGRGKGAGPTPRAPAPVEVIEKKTLGDFTSFTLKASDGKALGGWLKSNGFEARPEAVSWLDHYSKLDFFFVALRYDGKQSNKKNELLSKTLRISFDTPSPYYPYLEPAKTPEDPTRKLYVWFVASELMTPVARLEGDGAARLVKPWSEGQGCHVNPRGLIGSHASPALKESLPRNRELQVFVDLKPHRHGFGDVLFAPQRLTACDEACTKARLRLLPLLAPGSTTPDADPAKLVVTAPSEQTPSPLGLAKGIGLIDLGQVNYHHQARSSCSLSSPAGSSSLGWLGLIAGTLVALRRRNTGGRKRSRKAGGVIAVLGLLLVGCEESAPPQAASSEVSPPEISSAASAGTFTSPPLPAPAPEPAFSLASDKPAAQKQLLGLLAGKPSGWFETRSIAAGVGLGRVDFRDDLKLTPERCADTPRVESLVRYRVHQPEAGPRQVTLWGHAPKTVQSCLKEQIAKAKLPANQRTLTGSAGVGTVDGDQRRARTKVHGKVQYGRGSSLKSKFRVSNLTLHDPGLPEAVVKRIVRRRYSRFRKCYEDELAKSPALTGTVALTATIGADGKTTKVKPGKSRAKNLITGAMAGCCQRSIRHDSYPSPTTGKPMKFTLELTFAPGTKKKP